jgi:hypothetical protein
VRALIEDEYKRLIRPINLRLDSLWNEFNIHMNSPAPHSGHMVSPSGAAHGDILIHDATGWTRLSAGVAGQVLQTNGAGVDPSWAASGGGMSQAQILARQYFRC